MLISGRRTPASKIAARDEAMRRADIGRSARRTYKSLGSLPPQDPPDGDFDRAGHAQFLRQWAAELGMIGEIERERLEDRIAGYFHSGASPAGWMDIVRHLRALRIASMPPEPVVAPRRYHYDTPPRDGW